MAELIPHGPFSHPFVARNAEWFHSIGWDLYAEDHKQRVAYLSMPWFGIGPAPVRVLSDAHQVAA